MKPITKKWLDHRVKQLDRHEFWTQVAEIALPFAVLIVFWLAWIMLAPLPK